MTLPAWESARHRPLRLKQKTWNLLENPQVGALSRSETFTSAVAEVARVSLMPVENGAN